MTRADIKTTTDHSQRADIMDWILVPVLLVAVTTIPPSNAGSCNYNFSSGNDVIFLLDHSQSISDNSLTIASETIRKLIINRMLIGPDDNYDRLAFISFYTRSYSLIGPDYIRKPLPVYESEFFAPGGVYDISRKPEPTSVDNRKTGLAEAIDASIRFFVGRNVERPKIFFFVTDFHFDGDMVEIDLTHTIEAARKLRRNVMAVNGSLQAYGIGVGTYLSMKNMFEILNAANDVNDTNCGRNLKEWNSYLSTKQKLEIKEKSYGPRRFFYNSTLCCQLCYKRNNVSLANCSLEEFRSDVEEADLLDPDSPMLLNCAPTGLPMQCSGGVTKQTTVTTYTAYTSPEWGPEGPDPPESGEEGPDPEPKMNTPFLLLVLLFVVVNIVLLIEFILVCIYAHKLEPPAILRERQLKRIEQRKSKQKLRPTRIAPPPPKSTPATNGDTAPGPDNDYTNDWVSIEHELNRQRSNRISYLSLVRDDMSSIYSRFKEWTGSLVDRLQNYENESVIQQLHDKHQSQLASDQKNWTEEQISLPGDAPDAGGRKYNHKKPLPKVPNLSIVNETDENQVYENQAFGGNWNERKTGNKFVGRKYSPNVYTSPGASGNDELMLRLEQRRLKTDQY